MLTQLWQTVDNSCAKFGQIGPNSAEAFPTSAKMRQARPNSGRHQRNWGRVRPCLADFGQCLLISTEFRAGVDQTWTEFDQIWADFDQARTDSGQARVELRQNSCKFRPAWANVWLNSARLGRLSAKC